MTAEEMIKELSKFDPGRHVYYISRDEEPSRIDRIYESVLYENPETGHTAPVEPDEEHPDRIQVIMLEY